MFDETLITTDFVTLTVKDFFLRLAVTIGIGLVVGLEREYASIRDKQHHLAGVRSFTLVTLLGFLSALLAGKFGMWMLYMSFAGLLVVVAVSYYVSSEKGELGTTTEFSLIACFMLGILTLLGYLQISLPLTVIVLILLSLKMKFKSIAGSITQEEVYAFVKFIVLVALILPFLPNETIDPYAVVNPKGIMVVIILASGLNFAGYLLIKILGADKGIFLTGIAGGFFSSTAVSWIFSKKSKTTPEYSRSYSAAILLASTIMPLRVMLLLYIFNKSLLLKLSAPLVIIIFSGLVFSFFLRKKNADVVGSQELQSENPLNLIESLKFGALFVLILYFVHFAMVYFGTKGILLASAISGLTDVDAITISLAKLQDAAIENVVQNAILLAVLSNTIVKMFIVLLNGSTELKRHVATGYGLMFIAGIAGFLILNFL